VQQNINIGDAGNERFLYIGRNENGSSLCNNRLITLEGEDFVITGSSISDSSRSSGAYRRYSVNGTAFGSQTVSGEKKLANGIWRVFAVARTSVVSGATISISTATSLSSNGTFENTGTWELLDLGIINRTGDKPYSLIQSGDETYSINLISTASTTIEVDCIFFLPIVEFVVSPVEQNLVTSENNLTLYASEQRIYDENYGKYVSSIGGVWYASPSILNRFVYLYMDEEQEHDLNWELTVELTITPRTSHLLGTA
jgi:hypothetical protein